MRIYHIDYIVSFDFVAKTDILDYHIVFEEEKDLWIFSTVLYIGHNETVDDNDL